MPSQVLSAQVTVRARPRGLDPLPAGACRHDTGALGAARSRARADAQRLRRPRAALLRARAAACAASTSRDGAADRLRDHPPPRRARARGLGQKERCASDARVTYAALTEAGVAKFVAAQASHLADLEELFALALHAPRSAEQLAELLGRLPLAPSPPPARAWSRREPRVLLARRARGGVRLPQGPRRRSA